MRRGALVFGGVRGEKDRGSGEVIEGARELEAGVVMFKELWGEVFIDPRGGLCEGVNLRETPFMAEPRWGPGRG